jgi:hypothetical protein
MNLGFLGQVSRIGDRGPIVARQASSANALNINFGDPVRIVQDTTATVTAGQGGTYQSFRDLIIGTGTDALPVPAASAPLPSPLLFAGVAVREVKTNLTYPPNPYGGAPTGYYAPGDMCEALERGTICVYVQVATGIKQGGTVYVRILYNAAITAGKVGGFEAQADVVLTTTATVSAASTSITLAAGTSVAVGMYIEGVGIPIGTFIASGSGTSWVLSQACPGGVVAGTTVKISNTIPLAIYSVPLAVFRTGIVDGNSVAEITLLQRVGA